MKLSTTYVLAFRTAIMLKKNHTLLANSLFMYENWWGWMWRSFYQQKYFESFKNSLLLETSCTCQPELTHTCFPEHHWSMTISCVCKLTSRGDVFRVGGYRWSDFTCHSGWRLLMAFILQESKVLNILLWEPSYPKWLRCPLEKHYTPSM